MVGLFDGSSQVNLSLIAGNLLPQAGMRGSAGLANGAFLEQIFDMSLCCPDFEGDKLRLFTHEEDAIFAGLLALDCEPINPLIQAIREQITLLDQRILNLRDEQLLDPRGLAAFRLAEQYCWIFAACCCLQFWYYNRTLLSEVLRDTAWITLAVQLVLNKLNSTSFIDQQLQEVMADHLCLLYRQNKLFSVIPVPLAE